MVTGIFITFLLFQIWVIVFSCIYLRIVYMTDVKVGSGRGNFWLTLSISLLDALNKISLSEKNDCLLFFISKSKDSSYSFTTLIGNI